MDKEIGRLVKEMREEKEITINGLARGLCGESAFSYFEGGKRKLDNLMLCRVFDRIGIEIDEFSLMVNEEEYAYHFWKAQILEALEKEDWKGLEGLLANKKLALQRTYNRKIQSQYYYKLKAIYKVKKESDYKAACGCLEKSIVQTMPKIFDIEWERLCLGEEELHLLMLYLYYGTKGDCLEKDAQIELCQKLENYITIEHMETKKLAKLYPKLVCIRMQLTELTVDERKLLCEKAIGLLQDARRLHDITEVLRLYVEILQETKDEKVIYYRKHYKNFSDIFSDAGMKSVFRPEILLGRREKLFLITEYLSSMRSISGLTQAETSFDICEPETYSRIETGQHTPVKTNMYALAERLGISWCYCRGEIGLKSLKAYRMYQKVKKLSNRGEIEEAFYVLESLSKLLDMENPVNVQYVELEKIIAERKLGKIHEEQAYERLEKILKLTTILPEENQFRYYSQMELEILGEMGKMLYLQKKYDEGICLLESVVRNQKKSRVIWEYQWGGLVFLLEILSDLYFGAREYERSNQVIGYVLKRDLSCLDAVSLPQKLDGMADNYEHIGEQYSNVYKKLYRQTYYIADFFRFEKVLEFINKYYKEKFDENIQWY